MARFAFANRAAESKDPCTTRTIRDAAKHSFLTPAFQERIPCEAEVVLANTGSFDCVRHSLRQCLTSLRMTVLGWVNDGFARDFGSGPAKRPNFDCVVVRSANYNFSQDDSVRSMNDEFAEDDSVWVCERRLCAAHGDVSEGPAKV